MSRRARSASSPDLTDLERLSEQGAEALSEAYAASAEFFSGIDEFPQGRAFVRSRRRRVSRPTARSTRAPATPPLQTGNTGLEEYPFDLYGDYQPQQLEQPAAPPRRHTYQADRENRQHKWHDLRPYLLRERVISAAVPACLECCSQCGLPGVVRCLNCAHAYATTVLCAACDRHTHRHAHFHVRQHPGSDGWWAPLAPQQDVSDEGIRVEASEWRLIALLTARAAVVVAMLLHIWR